MGNKEMKNLKKALEELLGDFAVNAKAEAVAKSAEAKIGITLKSYGDHVEGHFEYEGNGAGYIYGAYLLLSHAAEELEEDIAGLAKIIPAIGEISENGKEMRVANEAEDE